MVNSTSTCMKSWSPSSGTDHWKVCGTRKTSNSVPVTAENRTGAARDNWALGPTSMNTAASHDHLLILKGKISKYDAQWNMRTPYTCGSVHLLCTCIIRNNLFLCKVDSFWCCTGIYPSISLSSSQNTCSLVLDKNLKAINTNM